MKGKVIRENGLTLSNLGNVLQLKDGNILDLLNPLQIIALKYVDLLTSELIIRTAFWYCKNKTSHFIKQE